MPAANRTGSPWVPLAIYAAFTLVSAVFLAIGGARQVAILDDQPGYHASAAMPQSPGYFGVLTNWDGQWFRSIAEHGYPVPLPTENGSVVQNEWAFFPIYPLLARGLMALTSLPFALSGWILSVVFGGVAMVLLYRLVVPRAGAFNAGALVACVCAFPTAVLFQVAYPESLAMLLVVAALYALHKHRYVVVMFAALGLALTRPIVLPLALVILVHGVYRWRTEGDSFTRAQRWMVAITAIVTGLLLGLWPLLADLTTGHRNTYLDTLAAWPVNQRSQGTLGGWFPEIFSFSALGWFALATIIGAVFVAVRRGARLGGWELRTWALVYPLYLFAATRPSPSIIRYLMLSIALIWPIYRAAQLPQGRMNTLARWAPLVLILAVELALQYYWTTHVFTFSTSAAEVWFP